VEGVNCQAVVDTGAAATVISNNLAKKVGLKPDTSKQVNLMNAADGSEMTAFGGVTATIQIGKRTFEWKVFIAPIRDAILL